jgi:hypothetical protein
MGAFIRDARDGGAKQMPCKKPIKFIGGSINPAESTPIVARWGAFL